MARRPADILSGQRLHVGAQRAEHPGQNGVAPPDILRALGAEVRALTL